MADKTSYNASLIRMWRVYRTVKEMLFDRGYQILEEDYQITLEEFEQQFAKTDGDPDRTRMPFSAVPTETMLQKYAVPPTPKDPNPSPQIGTIWVEFNADENVGMKQLRESMQHLSSGNYYSGIFVAAKPISSAAVRLMRGVANMEHAPPGGLEIFIEQDLLVNITKHELVPKHVLLSREEKAQLLQRYRLKESQLPRIQVTDPVAKYLGLKRGQVVKIIRKSETAGRYASYRWAI